MPNEREKMTITKADVAELKASDLVATGNKPEVAPEKIDIIRTHMLHEQNPGFTFCGKTTSTVYVKTVNGKSQSENLIAHKADEVGQKTPWVHPICHQCVFAHQKFGKSIVDAAARKQALLDMQRHPEPMNEPKTQADD